MAHLLSIFSRYTLIPEIVSVLIIHLTLFVCVLIVHFTLLVYIFIWRIGVMVKKFIPAVFLTIFMALSTGHVFAEAVVVEGDKIFIADDTLSVLNLDDGQAADCSEALDTVSGATDVVISDDGNAIVTVGDAGSISVEIVDVSDCLDGTSDVDVDECVATIDLEDGSIEIPCVYHNGVVYEIEMDQRGNSSNWEISFVDGNNNMLDYRRDGNDNDDNSNDNDDDAIDNDDNSNDNDDDGTDNDDNSNDNDA